MLHASQLPQAINDNRTHPALSNSPILSASQQHLSGKVALVTGGSKGIGRRTCLALARAGASVVVNYSSDSSSADSLVQEIGSERAFAIKADAGSVQGTLLMVKEAVAKFGGLDIVVANAGKILHGICACERSS